MISLSEHTELLLIIIKYLLIRKHNKDYMSVGLGMCIFISNVADSNSWLCELCQLTF